MANAKIISFVAAQIAAAEAAAYAELDNRLIPLQEAIARLRADVDRLQQGGDVPPVNAES